MSITDRLHRLLIVDDDPQLLALMTEFLRQYYHVDAVNSGDEALTRLAANPYDLVISDINMPGMKGYELLTRIRNLYPGTRTALITAWSLEDFINNVLEHNIGNIISKTVPFNFEEFQTTVEKILSGNIFGLERYLHSGAHVQRMLIQSTQDIFQLRQKVMSDLVDETFDEYRKMVIRLMLDESVSNAAYHPYGNVKGSEFHLTPEQAVIVDFGKDDEKIGIAVSDQMGKLTQRDVLSRLAECVFPTEESLLRDSGRGLYLMHSMVDRLIINIKRGCRTEVILLVYTGKEESGHRPVMIYEV